MKKINENKNDKKRNSTIDKVLKEMSYASNKLLELGAYYIESFTDCYGIDLYYSDSDKIKELEAKYNYQYNLINSLNDYNRKNQPLYKTTLYDYSDNAYDCEFSTINWNINSNKNQKNITYQSNGDILYKNKSKTKKNNKIDYTIKYNVNNNDINIYFNNNNNIINIDISGSIITIKTNNTSIIINTNNNNKNISYICNINNNRALVETRLNEYNEVLSRNVLTINEDFTKENTNYDNYIEENIRKINKSISDYNELYNMDLELYNIELELIDEARNNAFNYIKSIYNDILLYGLNSKLEIALSLIKNKIVEERKTKVKSKK